MHIHKKVGAQQISSLMSSRQNCSMEGMHSWGVPRFFGIASHNYTETLLCMKFKRYFVVDRLQLKEQLMDWIRITQLLDAFFLSCYFWAVFECFCKTERVKSRPQCGRKVFLKLNFLDHCKRLWKLAICFSFFTVSKALVHRRALGSSTVLQQC